jgi:hypothetical protein
VNRYLIRFDRKSTIMPAVRVSPLYLTDHNGDTEFREQSKRLDKRQADANLTGYQIYHTGLYWLVSVEAA